MLLAALPLAHQTRSYIEVAGEDRLAGALPQPELPGFFGLQGRTGLLRPRGRGEV